MSTQIPTTTLAPSISQGANLLNGEKGGTLLKMFAKFCKVNPTCFLSNSLKKQGIEIHTSLLFSFKVNRSSTSNIFTFSLILSSVSCLRSINRQLYNLKVITLSYTCTRYSGYFGYILAKCWIWLASLRFLTRPCSVYSN